MFGTFYNRLFLKQLAFLCHPEFQLWQRTSAAILYYVWKNSETICMCFNNLLLPHQTVGTLRCARAGSSAAFVPGGFVSSKTPIYEWLVCIEIRTKFHSLANFDLSRRICVSSMGKIWFSLSIYDVSVCSASKHSYHYLYRCLLL